ncbi:MAG: sucrase ferredoxin [Acidimicrobiales bacterium]
MPASARDLRCSAFARAEHLDPVGSAGDYDGYLLLEWPLPWSRDLADDEALAPLSEVLVGNRLRLQGLVPLFSDERARRAVLYRRAGSNPDDGFRQFERAERVVPADRLLDAAVELVTTGNGDPDWERASITDDVLVCTHGKRDVCCGSMGMSLVQELSQDPARSRLRGLNASSGGTVRLWRTSHTGGHRFAPTAIVLPQGTAWAYADADLLRRVVRRQGALDDALARYRGCAGVGPAPVQAVEREAFRHVGWEWLDWRRRGVELGGGAVRLEATAPDGEQLTLDAQVEVARMVPVPDCGKPIEDAKKSEPEWVVRSLTRSQGRRGAGRSAG